MMPVKNSAGLYELTLDGAKYEFEKWGAERATDTLLDLAALVGAPLGSAVQAAGKTGGLDRAIIPMVMDQLARAVGAQKVLCRSLLHMLATDPLCNGGPINFDKHYADKLPLMFQVVRASLEVQFGNFFAAIRAVAGPALQQQKADTGKQAT